MLHALLSIAAAGFALVGGHAVARLWPGRAAYGTVLGISAFALAVAAAHAAGVLAAVAGRPVVAPGPVAVLAAALSAVVWRSARAFEGRLLTVEGRRGGREPWAACVRRDCVASAAVILIGLAFAANTAILGVSAPPRGWDVLTYHLPRAVAWLQHGNLGHHGFSPAYYPGNGEIAVLFTLFCGTDRFASLVQLPFAFLGAAATYGIALTLGARGRAPLAAATVFLLSPIVLFQSAMAKNDLIVAALVMSGTYVLTLSLARDSSGVRRALGTAASGLAFGLALGTKYTILPFVVATVPVVFLADAWPRRRDDTGIRAGWRPSFATVALYAGALALPSLFWFVQNWLQTGNPVAPVGVSIGGVEFFTGQSVAGAFGEQELNYVVRQWEWWWFPWIDRALEGSYSNSVGFGAAFAAFFLPALALLLRRSLRREPAALVVLTLLAIGVAVWWLGGFRLPRYLLPTFGLACAPIALVFDVQAGRPRIALATVLAAALLFSGAETMRIVHVTRNFVSSRLPFPTKAQYYHMPELVYELEPGTRILLLQVANESYHRTFRYPLVGDLPGNDVVMMDDVGVRLTEAVGDPEAMHAALRRERIDYVFARTLTMMPQNTWFDGYPELYEKVVDTIERPYPWHRMGMVRQREDGRYEGIPAVTRMYRVIQGP